MPPEEHRQDQYTDLLKLTDSQFQALFAASTSDGDSAGGRAAPGNARDHGRMRFTFGRSIPMTLQEPNGAVRNVRAYPIDISTTGMALFVGMFVHLKTRVCATLTFNDGERLIVNGTCANCRMIAGRAHRIGIQFVKPFDLSLLLSPDLTASLAKEPGDAPVASSPVSDPMGGAPIPISGAISDHPGGLLPSQNPSSAGGERGLAQKTQPDPKALNAAALTRVKQATKELVEHVAELATLIERV